MGKTLRDSEDALLKKITVANYRQDPYYARIVKAVEGLLREKGFVAPLELFIRMDLLSPERSNAGTNLSKESASGRERHFPWTMHGVWWRATSSNTTRSA
jgi:hypothetical protein